MDVSYGQMQSTSRTLERVEEKVEEVAERMDKLEAKIESIIKTLEAMNKDTESMGKHVEFVEGVYDQVKRPFHFLMSSVEQLSQVRLIRAGPEDEPTSPVRAPVRARRIGYGLPVDL